MKGATTRVAPTNGASLWLPNTDNLNV